MADYPTLTEMGIRSFDQVCHYHVRSEQSADVLKIYYRRESKSLLPRSKKFTFVHPRAVVPLQYRHQKGWEQFQNSSPRLHKALEELVQLTRQPPKDNTPANSKEQFLRDLDHLEKVMVAKIAEMRRQVEALD